MVKGWGHDDIFNNRGRGPGNFIGGDHFNQ